MTRPAASGRSAGPDGIDLAIAIVLGGLLLVGIVQWLIGNLAALLGRARLLHGTPIDAVKSLPGLMKHAGNPAAAWPAAVRANLPGPVPYWIATVLVLAAGTALGLAAVTLLGHRRQEPIDKRRRLGVATQPRLATRRDLTPLHTRRPEPNRFVLARHGRGYLSTEALDRPGRRGVAGAVAVFGPSQSGKTTGLIDGVAAWTGPAIISSVKADLLRGTIGARRQTGDVRVFDPLGVTGLASSTWSPLRPARTLTGALTAAGIAARYLHAHGMSTGSQTATSSAVADQRRRVSTSSAHPMTVNGEAVNLAACATGIDYAFFYDGSSCTGSYLSMVSNDQIPHFGTYGFTDKTSSLDVGRCISNVDVWVDGSYTGNHTTFGGDDFYNAMPSGFNNSISSAKTDSSGAC